MTEPVGAQRVELRAARTLPILLCVLGAVFALAALWDPLHATIRMTVFGALALVLLAWAVVLIRRSLVLDARGVTARSAFGETTIAWDEVDHYTFWSMDQNMYVYAGGPQGAGVAVVTMLVLMLIRRARAGGGGRANSRFQQGALKLFAADGRKLAIDTRYRNASSVLDTAFTELHTRLRARPTRDYWPYTLGEYELVHIKKGSLPLAEVDKISVAGATLVVRARGKKLAWSRAAMRRVHNGMLLLEELAERGLVVSASAGVFVPPVILGKLQEAASRHAAMPAARVVRR